MEEAQRRIRKCIETKSTSLDLSNLGLTVLPDNLPNSLTHLDCSRNKLTVLPDNLPNSLEHLICYNNKLTVLPDNLPNYLTYLYCYNNKLTCLPLNLRINKCYISCNNMNELYYNESLNVVNRTIQKYKYKYQNLIKICVIAKRLEHYIIRDCASYIGSLVS